MSITRVAKQVNKIVLDSEKVERAVFTTLFGVCMTLALGILAYLLYISFHHKIFICAG